MPSRPHLPAPLSVPRAGHTGWPGRDTRQSGPFANRPSPPAPTRCGSEIDLLRPQHRDQKQPGPTPADRTEKKGHDGGAEDYENDDPDPQRSLPQQGGFPFLPNLLPDRLLCSRPAIGLVRFRSPPRDAVMNLRTLVMPLLALIASGIAHHGWTSAPDALGCPPWGTGVAPQFPLRARPGRDNGLVVEMIAPFRRDSHFAETRPCDTKTNTSGWRII